MGFSSCGLCAIIPLTRQFALEYSALFDGLLPALRRLGTPLPLGGTSNHFPRHVLEALGGWDPYNVTEDADLGIRLARAGYGVEVLDSTTWEEAPAYFKDWLPQRTRWLKGWFQTYLVHMRRPGVLARELGLWRFVGFQLLIGGFLLSALMHPLFYLVAGLELTRAQPFSAGGSAMEKALWAIALYNLAIGLFASCAMAGLKAFRRGFGGLVAQVVLMPVYWLLVSLAAYRAIWQLLVAPHLWEKTRHGARGGARDGRWRP